ncbi:MAG: peroxiredoxin [Pseudomonadota bacterium]
MTDTVAEGAAAPEFSLPADGGRTLSLSDFSGKLLVLYFYPKDDTSGCTKEAIGFTEAIGDFESAGAAIVGVSKDPVAKHDKFVAKHGLKVALVSDAESDLCERYGVWKEKSMYGKKYMGIERSTFLIGKDGTVLKAWRNVKVPGHVDAVLGAVKDAA